MLAKAILVHGVIGYNFFLITPFWGPQSRNTNWTRIKWHHCQGPLRGHESAETPIGNESPRIMHIIHHRELYIVSRDRSLWPSEVHVIDNPKLFIASRTLSSRSIVIHLNHILELLIASQALSSWLDVIHVIHNFELFIGSITLSSDSECFMSSITLSYSYHLEPLAHDL